VSLFSGCGGLDLGFVRAGFSCLGAVDLDEDALAVHDLNFSAPSLRKDLSAPNVDLPHAWRGVDVVVAGPPCQGFSTLGKRIVDDPRNSLLLRAAEIALSLKPKVVLIENVPGAISGEHRQFWERAKTLFSRSGYGISDFVVDARDFGVAQTRRRVVLMALDRNRQARLDFIQRTPKLLRDVLPRRNGSGKTALTGDALLIAKAIGPGQKLCNVRGGPRAVPTWHIPAVFGRTSLKERALLEGLRSLRRRCRLRQRGDADPVTYNSLRSAVETTEISTLDALIRKGYIRRIGSSLDLTHTFNGKYRRLSWDAAAPTVDTRFGSARYFLHPSEHRGFTIAEAAAVQSFPPDFKFLGSLVAQYRMIGNAVPPDVAEGLAEVARANL
jgi:DNA (cytosine-5)-methyltransferase 1